MQFPILVISYGNFVQNSKLFFYEANGIGCMPIFTDATVASLFLSSVRQRMGDMLANKPPLKVLACSEKRHALDMFRSIAMFARDVNLIEMNPAPLTEEHQQKLADYTVPFESDKYELPELIDLLQQQSEQQQE